jgi:hypothetical protein
MRIYICIYTFYIFYFVLKLLLLSILQYEKTTLEIFCLKEV